MLNWFNNLKMKTKILIGNSVAMVLMALMALATFSNTDSLLETANWVEHTEEVIASGNKLTKLLIDMETGERGFLITGKPEFLEPYDQGMTSFFKELNATKKLVSDNPEQVHNLEEIEKIVHKWITSVAEPAIAKRKEIEEGAVDAEYLQELLGRGVGKGIMGKIRLVVKELENFFKKKKNYKAQILVVNIAKDMVDQETGERGFLVTGKEEFLEPFEAGKIALNKHMAELHELVDKNAYDTDLVKKNVGTLERLTKEWLKRAAEPANAARREMDKHPTSIKDVSELIAKKAGKKIMDRLRVLLGDFTSIEEELIKERQKKAEEVAQRTTLFILFGTLFAILLTLTISWLIAGSITRPLFRFVKVAKTIAGGDLSQHLQITSRDEIGVLAKAFEKMTTGLRKISQEQKDQNWLKSHLAEISGKVQGAANMKILAKTFLNEFTPHMGGGYGAFYIKKTENHKTFLELQGAYGYEKRKDIPNQFEFGESLVGQCAQGRKPILLSPVPPDYIKINSGLGQGTPLNIILHPVIFEGDLLGVIELASFKEFTVIQKALLEQLAAQLGIIMNSVFASMQTEELLKESQSLTEELESQQEELKASNEELEEKSEELQCQQEELKAANEELEEKAEELETQSAELRQSKDEVESAKSDVEEKARDLALASKYKSEFLANMSHELRTPLNSLLILAKNLASNEEGNLSESQIESAEVISGSGNDLLRLINDILDLSKVEAGKLDVHFEDFKISRIQDEIKKQFGPITKEKNIELKTIIENGLPQTVNTDKQRLLQILRNLLSNAIKFTSRGSVILKVHSPGSGVCFRTGGLNAENSIAFSVIDTGSGIPEEKQRAIFEAFQQADGSTSRRFGGTGLGLTISRGLASLLNGEIQLQSKEGEGSTFTLYHPLEQKSAQLNEKDPQESLPASGPTPIFEEKRKGAAHSMEPGKFLPDDREGLEKNDKSVLIIEDDIQFAKILIKLAGKKGYKCLAAGDGPSGLYLASKYSPSAVILDVRLPGLDGLSVLDQLKFNLETRHIPVHIISGYDARNASLRKGAIGFMSKPVTEEGIGEVLSKFDHLLKGESKSILVADDDEKERMSIEKLLKSQGVKIITAASGQEALKKIKTTKFDCVILDLGLPDLNGFEVLKKLDEDSELEMPPVIINTGKELSREEHEELEKYTANIVIKDVHSPERLVDEASLFLHSVESSLPSGQQQIIRMLHDSDKLLKDRKILLVDDDMRNTYALAKLLREKKMEVLKAGNGEKALEILDNEESIDLVIMDIMMPIMDGYEAMRRIRGMKKFKDLPIIALTAKAMPEDRAKCMEAGASDYLNKPVEIEKLISMIRVWLFDRK